LIFTVWALGTGTTTKKANPTPSGTATTGASHAGGPDTYKIGESVAFSRQGGSTEGTITVSEAHYTTKSGDSFSKAQHGGWLLATVDITVAKGKMAFNPLYFKLVAPDGANYDIDPGAAGYSPDLKSGDLNAGDKTHGIVAFDVQKAAAGTGAKIQATDELLNTYASWKL
jgi:hypothetical protein